MRVKLILIFICVSQSLYASEKIIYNSQEHIVPNGKIWLIKNVGAAGCKVCTSDLYIDGGISIGTKEDIIIYGKYEISLNDIGYKELRLFAATKVMIGDSRGKIKVSEITE